MYDHGQFSSNQALAEVPPRDSDGLYVMNVLESRREQVLHLYTLEKEKESPGQILLKNTVALCHNRMIHGTKKSMNG